MAEPSYLRDVRASYDTVAVDYAEFVRPVFEDDVVGRAMLVAFARLVRATGGPVADVGCGPGHVTAFLHSLGLAAFGVELSPGMVAVARRDHPELTFDVGTMTDLALLDGVLGGIVAWYSVIHSPPEVLPRVFEEFYRVLAPGGHLLLGFHVGDERRRKENGYGHEMSLDLYRLPPDRLAELATRAGLTVDARLVEEPKTARAPFGCLLVRKPAAARVQG
ncbi:class I SAM-dependent DNA methyltransferase [Streptomyces zagrosensis]|uniref:SAM-dependent methyltransferase n=1 Tax=Streptomyces zagrosensis TaxID=1042984 RepID=A0A7W9Q3W1_9ACTN|nr:class I SAM-dependent methyltransferase [Streptomyces zagrosensis]MBB5933143.1 SAM-dependent methyltransferase [Streptomyces zagrosensis]